MFGTKNGWERRRPLRAGQSLASERRRPATVRLDAGRPGSSAVGAEHEAFRERVGIIDMTSFGKIERDRAGRARAARARLRQPDRPAGRKRDLHAVPQPPRRDRRRRDGDATRRGAVPGHHRRGDRRRRPRLARAVPAAGGRRGRDPRLQRRAGRDRDLGPGLEGRARSVHATMRSRTMRSRSATPATIDVGGAAVLAQRITYVGELGYELYVSPEWAVQVWDRLMAAGAEHGIAPGGYRVARVAAAREGLPLLRHGPHLVGHAVRERARVLRRARQGRIQWTRGAE